MGRRVGVVEWSERGLSLLTIAWPMRVEEKSQMSARDISDTRE